DRTDRRTIKKATNEAPGGLVDRQRVGLRPCLQSCGHDGCDTNDPPFLPLANADKITDDDEATGNADPAPQCDVSTELERLECGTQFQPSPNRKLGIIFVRRRIAKIHQYRIADVFGDKSI